MCVCVCLFVLYSMLRFFSQLTVLIGPVYNSHQSFMYKQMLTFVFLIKIGNHDVRVDNIVCMFFYRPFIFIFIVIVVIVVGLCESVRARASKQERDTATESVCA